MRPSSEARVRTLTRALTASVRVGTATRRPGEPSAHARHSATARKAAVVSVALGLSMVCSPAAAAAPGEGESASVSARDSSGASRVGHRASGPRPQRTPRGRAAQRPSPAATIVSRPAPAPAPVPIGSAQRTAAISVPSAASRARHPITSLLFNEAPTLAPTQDDPGLDGVVHGSLNSVDDDGDTLTYAVVRAPEHGQVSVDAGGNFTYTPADPGHLVATDTFDITVSDAGSGAHLHGLLGLINLLTFGLIGTAGHTTTRTVSVITSPGADPAAYVVPLAPGVLVRSVLTAGESPSGSDYPMVGAPDGLGVLDNNDGTFTLLMNHELGSGSGAVRAHGATGAFISEYTIDAATLEVVAGRDLIERVFAWDAATQTSAVSSSVVAFHRFCSGDLAAESAFFHDGLGTTARIFLTGEEGGQGRAVATLVTGADAGNSYILGRFDPGANGSGLVGTAGWENLLASPFAQDKTIVIGNNDGGSGIMTRSLAVYVGTKQNTGSEADRAGLTNGVLKFVSVTGNPVEITDSSTRATAITSGTPFTLSEVASTAFSRPEDGAWNPLNPNEYYFVTTDRLDTASDGVGSQVGNSRLWRLNFADITDPDLGGTIDLLVDGDTVDGQKVNMFDNITIDQAGRILIQEDTGGADHNAKIWRYDIGTDTLTLVAGHDPTRFGDIGIAATAPFTTNEESSGIVDASAVLGPGWFLLTVMAHYPQNAGLVEGGQLLALYDPV